MHLLYDSDSYTVTHMLTNGGPQLNVAGQDGQRAAGPDKPLLVRHAWPASLRPVMCPP